MEVIFRERIITEWYKPHDRKPYTFSSIRCAEISRQKRQSILYIGETKEGDQLKKIKKEPKKINGAI